MDSYFVIIAILHLQGTCLMALLLLGLGLTLRSRHQEGREHGQRRRRRPRPPTKRVWTREWLLRRPMYGHNEQLLGELNREDPRSFKMYLRVPPEVFEEIVTRLTPLLQKKTTRMREPLSVALKVATTLRFMATGCSLTELHFNFRVSLSAISKFIPQVCQAIIKEYQEETIKLPETPEEWKTVAESFSRKWNYHNCIGAIDGKHIPIKKPVGGGSYYFNYKKFHSIILMGICDASYRFLYVDIGAEGGAGDAGTWFRSRLNRKLENNTAGLPEPEPLPNDDQPIPYHLIGDDAFALKKYLMKPYSHRSQVNEERIFSYRLSRARRTVENCFGLLQARLRIFGVTLYLKPRKAMAVTMAGCVLHNLFLDRIPMHINAREVDREDEHHETIPGAWREGQSGLEGLNYNEGHNPQRQAKQQRDYLAQYYSSEAGSVPWQERMVFPRGRRT